MTMGQAAGCQIDIATFWHVLGVRAIGCAVVTARDANGPAGFLALSATHLAASPPTLMVSIDRRTNALSTVRNSGHFAINYLACGSDSLVDVFSGKGQLSGSSRFRQGNWTSLQTGAPILADAVGALDCVLEETLERHSAVIAIGRLVAFSSRFELQPLISFAGRRFALR